MRLHGLVGFGDMGLAIVELNFSIVLWEECIKFGVCDVFGAGI